MSRSALVLVSAVVCGMLFFTDCSKTGTPAAAVKNEPNREDQLIVTASRPENRIEQQSIILEWGHMIEMNEQRIAAFKEKVEETGPKAVLKFSDAVGIAEQKNIDLKKELQEYAFTGHAQWEVFKMRSMLTLAEVGGALSRMSKQQKPM